MNMIDRLKNLWAILKGYAIGRYLFSRLVGFFIPYTGSIKATVIELSPGAAKVCIKDRRKNRNHLRSIHAIALANLAEFCGGLALHFSLTDEQCILTNLSIEYTKKARGIITAKSEIDRELIKNTSSIEVISTLFDEKGDKVAIGKALWQIRKNKS